MTAPTQKETRVGPSHGVCFASMSGHCWRPLWPWPPSRQWKPSVGLLRWPNHSKVPVS